MTDFERLLAALAERDARVIIIGGFAAIAHGSAFLTVDLDLVYQRTSANIERLVAAIAPLDPYLRGAPPGLPFRLDAETMARGLNFTLRTTAGDIDLLAKPREVAPTRRCCPTRRSAKCSVTAAASSTCPP